VGLLVAGIQPGYLPWLGFFDQMRRADVFIVADEMPFSTDGWAHRNRILGPHGPLWLTVPTRRDSRHMIRDVRIDDANPWRRKHLAALRHAYPTGASNDGLLEAIERALPASPGFLVDASIPLLRCIADLFGIRTPLVVSSEAGLEARFREECGPDADATDRVISYVRSVGGDRLLEGETGAAYLDVQRCRERGVEPEFHRYRHPRYDQGCEAFVSHLSSVDLLLRVGAAQAGALLEAAA